MDVATMFGYQSSLYMCVLATYTPQRLLLLLLRGESCQIDDDEGVKRGVKHHVMCVCVPNSLVLYKTSIKGCWLSKFNVELIEFQHGWMDEPKCEAGRRET